MMLHGLEIQLPFHYRYLILKVGYLHTLKQKVLQAQLHILSLKP